MEYYCEACQDSGEIYINGKWQLCGCQESSHSNTDQEKTGSGINKQKINAKDFRKRLKNKKNK